MNIKDSNKRAILRREKDGLLVPNTQTLATTMRVEGLNTINRLTKAYNKDAKAKELRKEQPNATVLSYQGKTYIPGECVEEMIQDHYNDPMHGHPGVTRTMELIHKNYNTPRLRPKVEQYIKEYIKYQQNKSARHKPYGNI